METNNITCPKCGHLNNYISEGCVKCGIIFSKYKDVRETGKKLADAGDPGEENKFNVGLEPKPDMDTEPTQLEIERMASEARLKADASIKEPESAGETDPDPLENPFETVAGISEEKIGIPKNAETVSAANEMPMAAETAAEPETNPSIPVVSDQQAQSMAAADTTLAESEAQRTSPLAVSEKEKQAIPQIPDEQSTAAAVGEHIPEEEVIELTEPLEKEQEILLEEVADPVEAIAAPAESENEAATELLKNQKAALLTAEGLDKEKQTQDHSPPVKKQKPETATLEALKKQKTAQAKAEALGREILTSASSEITKKSESFRLKTQALKQQEEAQTEAEALVQESQTIDKGTSLAQQQVQEKSLEPKLKIMRLLKKYEGKTIGINYDNSAEIKEAQLVEANDEFFSVMVKDKKLQYSYPLQTLLSLIEGEDGVKTEEAEPMAKFDAVIKVYPLVLF